MSILSNLIGIRVLSGIKPSGFICVLAFIYLGFLCFNTFYGAIFFIILCLLIVVLMVVISNIEKNRPKSSWDDHPEVIAKREARARVAQASANEDTDPYA